MPTGDSRASGTWSTLANQATYSSAEAVGTYGKSVCWLDDAERLLLHKIADEVRGSSILDVGVGTGRTSWLLRLLTANYKAVDFAPAMVAACRDAYPDIDVMQADARELRMFAASSFDLVVFSFNGLDVLNHEGRIRALSEFHRVLRPGGLLMYSTTNRSGPNYGQRPWRVKTTGYRSGAARGTRSLTDLPSSLPRHWRSFRNWWVRRPFAEDHGSWAIATLHSHEFSLLLHFTLPSTEREALASLGFATEACLDCNGKGIEGDSTTSPWFHILARKRSSSSFEGSGQPGVPGLVQDASAS